MSDDQELLQLRRMSTIVMTVLRMARLMLAVLHMLAMLTAG